MKEDEAIQQFLGDRPGVQQLREWRETLERRLKELEAERGKPQPGKAGAALAAKIAQLKRQVAALREEEAITGFVEDSVRVTLAMGTITEGLDQTEE